MSDTTVNFARSTAFAGAIERADRTTRDALAALQRRAIAWRRHQQRRALASATRDALRRLDDRTLHDLGLHRSEIGSVGVELHDRGDRRERRRLHP